MMRRHSLIVGRARWAVATIGIILAAALFIVTSGARAVAHSALRSSLAARVSPSSKPLTTAANVSQTSSALQVQMQLMPQSFRSVLRSGIKVRVKANRRANGYALVLLSRANAKRLHIRAGHTKLVVIGEGTVWQVKKGTVFLHLHLSHGAVKKLQRVKHLALTVGLVLISSDGSYTVTGATGNY